MTRLATNIWVGAYLARLAAAGIPAHLIHKGDQTAGAVAVKLAFMNGQASFYTRSYGCSGRLEWHALIEDRPECEVDGAIARRRGFDRDLWVIEVEDPRGRHMLDGAGLEE